MIEVRKKNKIFKIEEDWFTGYWHFSFGVPPQGYYDPDNAGFGSLRVHNVDTLVPGGVWPMHPHQNIEVITYCLDGEFQHADQSGKGGILYKGDVQHTTVGRGMLHEEINHRRDVPMTFLQIWIMPREQDLEPAMQQRSVDVNERMNRFLTLVSNKDPKALPIEQDAEFVVSSLRQGKSASRELEPGYGAYVYVVSGQVTVNGQSMSEGDAATIVGEPSLNAQAEVNSELTAVIVRV